VIDHLAASFLSGLGAAEYQSSENSSGSVVTADMVDDVAKRHFPPCMRNVYERLKKDHHLKHFGRLQLVLFLKVSGGMTLRSLSSDSEEVERSGMCFRKEQRSRIVDSGSWTLDPGPWILDQHLGSGFGLLVLGFGPRVLGRDMPGSTITDPSWILYSDPGTRSKFSGYQS
jgi:hypothetical protein